MIMASEVSSRRIWSHVLVEWAQMDSLFQPISASPRIKVCRTCVHFAYSYSYESNTCSDITNDQLGISSETDAVARISMFIVCTVLPPVKWWFKFIAGVSHHTPPPPGGGLASAN